MSSNPRQQEEARPKGYNNGDILIDISPSASSKSNAEPPTKGDVGALSIEGSPSDVVGAAAGSDPKQLPRWLFASGFATMVMDAATAFYRSPHGAVFQQHRSAYYATLAGIFTAGLAEVGTACWLASFGKPGRARGRAFRASVVCASVVPLVAIIALGGFAVVMKG